MLSISVACFVLDRKAVPGVVAVRVPVSGRVMAPARGPAMPVMARARVPVGDLAAGFGHSFPVENRATVRVSAEVLPVMAPVWVRIPVVAGA